VVERAYGIEVAPNAHLLRNLVQGAGIVSDHILHFYHRALLDYVNGPKFPPYTPAWGVDQRFGAADVDRFLNDYMMAFEMRKMAQEAAALFAGKVPQVMTFSPGGVTQRPTKENVAEFRRLLEQLAAAAHPRRGAGDEQEVITEHDTEGSRLRARPRAAASPAKR
jgi:hydrogenase large subunit